MLITLASALFLRPRARNKTLLFFAPAPDPAHWIRTFAIITTDANELVADIHDRMPVILAPIDYARWLIAIASFGLAALGLFTIFNSTSTQISLAACAMYIVGSVLGVLLLQTES